MWSAFPRHRHCISASLARHGLRPARPPSLWQSRCLPAPLQHLHEQYLCLLQLGHAQQNLLLIESCMRWRSPVVSLLACSVSSNSGLASSSLPLPIRIATTLIETSVHGGRLPCAPPPSPASYGGYSPPPACPWRTGELLMVPIDFNAAARAPQSARVPHHQPEEPKQGPHESRKQAAALASSPHRQPDRPAARHRGSARTRRMGPP